MLTAKSDGNLSQVVGSIHRRRLRRTEQFILAPGTKIFMHSMLTVQRSGSFKLEERLCPHRPLAVTEQFISVRTTRNSMRWTSKGTKSGIIKRAGQSFRRPH